MPDLNAIQKKNLQDAIVLATLQATLATKNKEAAKTTQEAQDALVTAYKGPAVTAPTGAVTAETPFIETQVLANRTLAAALTELVAECLSHLEGTDDTKSLTLLLLNPLDFPALTLYATVHTQLTLLSQDYPSAITVAQALLHPASKSPAPARANFIPNPVQAGTIAAGVVRTAADLVSLFLPNTTFKNADLTLTDTLVAATFVQAVKKAHSEWRVFASAIFPPNTLDPKPASVFLEELDKLRQTDQQSLTLQQQLQTALLTVPPLAEPELTQYTDALAALTALHTAYHDLRLQLTAATPGQSILEAERLATLYGADNTYVVKLQATSKGSMRLVHRLFNIGGDKMTFSAGTELSYLVFKPRSGAIIQAGSIWKYQDYIKASEINNQPRASLEAVIPTVMAVVMIAVLAVVLASGLAAVSYLWPTR